MTKARKSARKAKKTEGKLKGEENRTVEVRILYAFYTPIYSIMLYRIAIQGALTLLF